MSHHEPQGLFHEWRAFNAGKNSETHMRHYRSPEGALVAAGVTRLADGTMRWALIDWLAGARGKPAIIECGIIVCARLGRDPLDGSLSDAEIERRKGKIYEEHASYAIEIELPSCGCCGRVAARCPCPWRCTLPVGAPPATDRAPCACGAPAAARAA